MKRLLFVIALIACMAHWGVAQDSSFIFSTQNPHSYVPAFIGNGHFSLVTSPWGTAPAQSFAARVYAHTPLDVPRIAALPAWNEINIFNGKHWLNSTRRDTNVLQTYRQQINMYDGELTTSYDWTEEGRITRTKVTAIVSRADNRIAAITLEIVPQYRGEMKISFPLQGWNPPKRLDLAVLEKLEPDSTGKPPDLWTVWHPGFMNVMETGMDQKSRSIWLVARADSSQTTVAEAAAVVLPANLRRPRVDYRKETNGVSLELTFDAVQGQRYLFSKYISIVSSAELRNPVQLARDAAAGAKAKGFETIRRENAAAWHTLWQTDIRIDGDPQLQKLVHAMMFYLLSSVDSATEFSIPPMGLSSSGYYGHVFWDADTYMFPPLLLMHPSFAQSMVMFRLRALDAAKRNAAKNGYAGAMYPWESDERGEETTPRFAAQNATHEIHVTGDVALAQWQYYLATGDRRWLAEVGYPVLKETADYWVSRVSYSAAKRRYEIKDVVSVDEGLIGINNDAYTNAVAEKNLRLAVKASAVLAVKPNPRWGSIADSLYIPYDPTRQLHPTYEQAPDSVLGSVTALLEYPLEMPMSAQARRNDLGTAAKRFLERGGGVMMGETFYPLIAAEFGDSSLFQELVPQTYRPHLRGPFWVLAETPGNDAIDFITGAGGFLQQVIFGYSGLRLGDNGLEKKFQPMLPRGVTRVTLTNFTVRGKKFDAFIEKGQVNIVQK